MTAVLAEKITDIPVLRLVAQPDGVPPAELRPGCPVRQVTVPAGGQPLTILRGREEVLTAITSRSWVMAGVTAEGVVRGHPLTGAEQQHPDGGLLNMDPPGHHQFRGCISRLFTPAAATATLTDVRATAAGLADGLAGRTTADLIADYIDPLIGSLICASLGLPQAQWPTIVTASDAAFSPVHSLAQVTAVDAAWLDIYQFYTHVVTTGSARHGGMIAQITRALNGHSLAQVSHVLATVSNGYPAARQSARRLFWELLAGHPADRAACQQHPELWESLTDKLLRTVALFPVALPRRAATDISLAGRHFPAGALVLPSLVAAAHDPRYPAPPRNIAFGYGPHACPGAALTRLWISQALGAFFARWPAAQLADEQPQWTGGTLAAPAAIMVTLR